MPIARTNGNNAQRIASVKRAIGFLQAAPEGMSVQELANAMTLSDSTIKGYLWAMLEGHVVSKRVDKIRAQHPVARYTLVADTPKIDFFLGSLRYDVDTKRPPVRAPKSQEERMAQDPSRHFHLAGDDEPVKVRVSRARVPAQWEVLATFFGMAVA